MIFDRRRRGDPGLKRCGGSVLPLFAAVLLACGIAACATKDPRRAGFYLERGAAYVQQGRFTSATRDLLEARKLNPDDYRIRYYLGIAYHGKKLLPEAIAEFKETIALNPDDSEAYNYLGTIYSEMGRWDEAIAEFKKALANILYETPAGPLNNMGYAYYRKGDYTTALTKFDEALIKEPDTILLPVIEKNRSMALFALGRFETAVEHLKRSIEIAHDNIPEAHYWLGKCYLEMKKNNAAMEEFRLVLRMAPNSDFADQAREGIKVLSDGRR